MHDILFAYESISVAYITPDVISSFHSLTIVFNFVPSHYPHVVDKKKLISKSITCVDSLSVLHLSGEKDRVSLSIFIAFAAILIVIEINIDYR